MTKAYCAVGDHYPDTLIADAWVCADEDGEQLERIQVQQDNDGTANGYYADGIKGVTEEIMVESELDESPVCFDHPECTVHWEHSERFCVWPVYDGSGEYEVLDFTYDEPSTEMFGTKDECDAEALRLNELHP